MKQLILIVYAAFTCLVSFAQLVPTLREQNNETEIRKLEKSLDSAILKGDTILIAKLFSPQIVVNSPGNTIVKFDGVMYRIRTGQIDYSSYEKVIEHISFVENIAIVMGKEIITPKGVTANAGKTVTRRFTDIWMKNKKSWQLTARQATIVLVL